MTTCVDSVLQDEKTQRKVFKRPPSKKKKHSMPCYQFFCVMKFLLELVDDELDPMDPASYSDTPRFVTS